jgi:hypothetical protein
MDPKRADFPHPALTPCNNALCGAGDGDKDDRRERVANQRSNKRSCGPEHVTEQELPQPDAVAAIYHTKFNGESGFPKSNLIVNAIDIWAAIPKKRKSALMPTK